MLFSGDGLGKEQHGIKEAIKVKMKCDKAGVIEIYKKTNNFLHFLIHSL